MRFADQQADLDRLKQDLTDLRQQKESVEEENARLQEKSHELERALEDCQSRLTASEEKSVSQGEELAALTEKLSVAESAAADKDDECISLRIEVNRLTEMEKKGVATIKSLKDAVDRQEKLIAHLKRLQISSSSVGDENGSLYTPIDETALIGSGDGEEEGEGGEENPANQSPSHHLADDPFR